MKAYGTVKYLLILSLIPLSCGAVHQMIPPTPLRHHENRIDFLLTYGVNNLRMMPDFGMHAYWGVGKNYTIGLGFSHVSIAKYFENDERRNTCIFASLMNIPLPIGASPNFEIGSTISVRDGDKIHAYSTGLWFVFNDIFPFLPNWSYESEKPNQAANAFYARPFIKYQFYKRNLGFSVQNYSGLTAKTVSTFRKLALGSSPTLIFKNADVDSVYHDSLAWEDRYVIATNSGERYSLLNYRPYDLWFPDIDIIIINKNKFDEDTQAYFFKPQNYPIEGMYEVNIRQINEDLENGLDIVLEYNQANTREIIKRIKWYKSDWSVGFRWMR